MRRVTVDPRPNWQKRVEEFGLFYHTLRGEPYWDESAFYQFTATEVERIYDATTALHKMCLDLVEEVMRIVGVDVGADVFVARSGFVSVAIGYLRAVNGFLVAQQFTSAFLDTWSFKLGVGL